MIYLILVFGLILRLISLNQSLWLDEATTALVSKMSLIDIFTKFLPGDFHPPFYYLILKYWVGVFGNSEISIRIPSVVFGAATIFVVFLIGKKLSNQNVGLFSALLLATSGLHIYYSQEARMYSLATFLISLAIYFFIEKKWILLSISLFFIGITDYVSLFVLPVFLIAANKEWKKTLFSFSLLIFGFGLWLPVFVKQLNAGASVQGSVWWDVLGPTSFKNILLIPIKFIIGRITFDNKIIYLIIIGFSIMIFSYLLFKARSASKIIWAWLLVPIAIGTFVSFKIPTLSYFRFLFCLPAFYIVLADGIEKMGKQKVLFLFLVITVNLLTSGYYLVSPRFHREDWRNAANYLGTNKIVFPSDSQKEALAYYGKAGQIVSVDILSKKDKEVLLSRYVWNVFDPNDSTRQDLEQLGYNKTSEVNFNGVVFWKYTKYENRN